MLIFQAKDISYNSVDTRPKEMDFDSAYIEPLLHEWLDRFQDVIQKEEESVKADDEFHMPFIAIPTPIISTIFHITEHLELGRTTKYTTIHLYDKFMCKYFWEIYKTESASGPKEVSWYKVCNMISGQSKLYLMSCMQIASKMDSHSKILGISQVLDILCRIDANSTYTRNIIFAAEFKVFKTVGFNMPLYTPLHCVEFLLAMTGLRETQQTTDASMILLDLTYLRHQELYSRLQCLIRGRLAKTEPEKKDLMSLKSNALFLGASIVLCASFFSGSEIEATKYIAVKLSELIDIKDSDICNMANILLAMTAHD